MNQQNHKNIKMLESIHSNDFETMGMCPCCGSENYDNGVCNNCGYINTNKKIGEDYGYSK